MKIQRHSDTELVMPPQIKHGLRGPVRCRTLVIPHCFVHVHRNAWQMSKTKAETQTENRKQKTDTNKTNKTNKTNNNCVSPAHPTNQQTTLTLQAVEIHVAHTNVRVHVGLFRRPFPHSQTKWHISFFPFILCRTRIDLG